LFDISSRKTIRMFGIYTVIFWLSYVIYLPPFVQSPNIKGLIDEGYEMYKSDHPNASKQQLVETKLYLSFIFLYAKLAFFIVTGIISGLFIFGHKRIGRILALVLCIVMLGSRVLAFLMAYPNIIHRLRVIYVFLLSYTPLAVIHKDIVTPIFLLMSIVYLFKKSVAQEFLKVPS